MEIYNTIQQATIRLTATLTVTRDTVEMEFDSNPDPDNQITGLDLPSLFEFIKQAIPKDAMMEEPSVRTPYQHYGNGGEFFPDQEEAYGPLPVHAEITLTWPQHYLDAVARAEQHLQNAMDAPHDDPETSRRERAAAFNALEIVRQSLLD